MLLRSTAMAALAVLVLGCASLSGLEAPEVVLVDLQPLDGEALEQRFEVRLRIINPNDRDLAIDGVDFTLDVNGSRLTRGVSNEAVTVPRLGDAVVSVTATTTLFDLVRQVVKAPYRKNIDYELRGRVFLAHSPARLTFERQGTIETTPPPKHSP